MAFLIPEVGELSVEVLPEMANTIPEGASFLKNVKTLVENIGGNGANILAEASEHLNNVSNLLNSLGEFHQNTRTTIDKFRTPNSASAIVNRNVKKLKKRAKNDRAKIEKVDSVKKDKVMSGMALNTTMNGVLTELYKEIDKKAPIKRLIQFYSNVLKVFHDSKRMTDIG